jgi:hypothetical protein
LTSETILLLSSVEVVGGHALGLSERLPVSWNLEKFDQQNPVQVMVCWNDDSAIFQLSISGSSKRHAEEQFLPFP